MIELLLIHPQLVLYSLRGCFLASEQQSWVSHHDGTDEVTRLIIRMEIAIKLLVLVVVQGALSSDNESHLWSRISHKDPHDDEWIHEGGRLRRRSLLSVEPPEGSEELPPLFQDVSII